MKKFLAILLITTAFCILSCVAASADANIAYDPDTFVLSVSGSYDNASGKSVTMQVIKPGKSDSDVINADSAGLKAILTNIRETRCNADGEFSFPQFKISGDSGYYSVRICLGGQSPQYIPKAFLYISPTFDAMFTQKFCDENVSGDDLADFIYNNADIVQADDFAFYAQSERNTIVSLCKRNAQSVKEALQRINCAIVAYEINKAPDETTVYTTLEKYKSYLKPECSIFETYESLNADGKALVAADVYKNKPFGLASGLIDSLGSAAIFASVKTADNYLLLEPVLKAASLWYDSDFLAYYALGNKKAAALEIIGKQFSDIGQLETAVGKAVEKALNTKKDSASSGGKSGSVVSIPQAPAEQVGDAAADTVFSDLDSAAWAKDAIETLHRRGVVSGVSDGVFSPHRFVTREEFAKMAIVAMGSYNPNAQSHFVDCPSAHWSHSYVASAYDAGVINGLDNEFFGIGQKISRQDMTVILYKVATALNVPLADGNNSSFIDDDQISPYAKLPISVMAESGLVNGMGDGSFEPLANATRAQAAKIIYEVLSRMEG
ncbi:MAG: S-layer homology domain-containing protein [Clostridia bacterium]|nr:S-layer homology domain-containing protein [Clostridia bacterium]